MAMSAVYKYLYGAEVSEKVDFGELLRAICAESEKSYSGESRMITCESIPLIVTGGQAASLAVLVNAYREETVEGEDEGRTVLKLQPSLAPVKAGIFPLVKKDGMPEMAHRIADDLRPLYPVFYDESGAIGRRYRRQDEIGTPFGITVDGESIAEGTVTIRDRDTLQQDRVAADQLRSVLAERLAR